MLRALAARRDENGRVSVCTAAAVAAARAHVEQAAFVQSERHVHGVRHHCLVLEHELDGHLELAREQEHLHKEKKKSDM